jgi:hypothetical protein
MKCLLFGFLGAVVAMVLASVVMAQYSDYRARSESEFWIETLGPTKRAVEANIAKIGSTSGAGQGVRSPAISEVPNTEVLIFPDGALFVHGGLLGHVVALIPIYASGVVTWRCVGGPQGAVPKDCVESGTAHGPTGT